MTPTPVAQRGTAKAPEHRRPSTGISLYKRVGTAVEVVLLVAVLGLIGTVGYALNTGTWMVTPVLSGSMRPGFAVGGVVISERVPLNRLAVRDVIVFRAPEKPSEQVVHRIVHIAKSRSGQLLINTQGDANAVRDPWTITIRGDYAYRVRWSVPLIGYAAIAYQNNHALAELGAGVVLILIAVRVVYAARPRGRHLKGKTTTK